MTKKKYDDLCSHVMQQTTNSPALPTAAQKHQSCYLSDFIHQRVNMVDTRNYRCWHSSKDRHADQKALQLLSIDTVRVRVAKQKIFPADFEYIMFQHFFL
jgi:hypothetical protein